MFNAVVRRLVLAGFVCVALENAAGRCSAAEQQAAPPLQALIDKHLRRDPNYRPGDLISRGNVEAIFSELQQLGVIPLDTRDGLYKDYLRDDSVLVLMLRTAEGRALMRKVSGLPGAYDRLERLSWLPTGQAWLRELIAKQDGDKVFAQMLTEAGMKHVAELLADDPRGQNFALPTGHVHTEADLLERLNRMLPKPAAQTSAKSTATASKSSSAGKSPTGNGVKGADLKAAKPRAKAS
jgi:hypothetical protein